MKLPRLINDSVGQFSQGTSGLWEFLIGHLNSDTLRNLSPTSLLALFIFNIS